MSQPEPKVIPVVLAAGASSRFGSNKMLANIGGETMVARAYRIASVISEHPVLVVGRDWQSVVEAALLGKGFFVYNDNYADGIGGSIAIAARSVFARADALLLMLADQPLVDETLLKRIVDTWSGRPNHAVASAFSEVQGPPILLPRHTAQELVNLSGDTGARFLLGDPRFVVESVKAPAAQFDIDTPDDMAKAERCKT